MEELRFYSKYLVLVVAIFATVRYSDIRNTKAKYFLYSIWYIFLTEFVGTYFYSWFGLLNFPVYGLYTFLQISFYLWWFRSLLKSEKRKKIVSAFVIIYITFCVVNAFFIQDIFSEVTSYSYAIGVIFLVTTICYYLIEVFNSEVVLKIRKSMYFWISLGLLLFHATFMPFYFAFDYFLLDNLKLLSVVNFTLCIIMYSCFGAAFVMAKYSAKEHMLTKTDG